MHKFMSEYSLNFAPANRERVSTSAQTDSESVYNFNFYNNEKKTH